jgi:tartrate-resistant acid phosphatase type 5
MIYTSKRPTPRCFYIVSLSLFITSLYITLSFGGFSFFETPAIVYEEVYLDAETLDFLIIGDWGNSGKGKDLKHGPQANVSKAMEFVANKHDSKFIVNVGDNFYKRSAKDYQGILSVNDSKWEEIWLNVYNSTKLRRLPWYTVAGNHDWYTNITAQIEYSLTVDSRFFFPSLFYVRSSLFGKEMKTKAVWIHIDTNVFYYNVDTIIEVKMEGLKTNLLNFGLHTQQAIQDKLKWIEQRLIENQDADYIFVVGKASPINWGMFTSEQYAKTS